MIGPTPPPQSQILKASPQPERGSTMTDTQRQEIAATATPVDTPSEFSAVLVRAKALIRGGDVEQAFEALDRAIAAAPEMPDRWRAKALMLRQLGRLRDAIE